MPVPILLFLALDIIWLSFNDVLPTGGRIEIQHNKKRMLITVHETNEYFRHWGNQPKIQLTNEPMRIYSLKTDCAIALCIKPKT